MLTKADPADHRRAHAATGLTSANLRRVLPACPAADSVRHSDTPYRVVVTLNWEGFRTALVKMAGAGGMVTGVPAHAVRMRHPAAEGAEIPSSLADFDIISSDQARACPHAKALQCDRDFLWPTIFHPVTQQCNSRPLGECCPAVQSCPIRSLSLSENPAAVDLGRPLRRQAFVREEGKCP